MEMQIIRYVHHLNDSVITLRAIAFLRDIFGNYALEILDFYLHVIVMSERRLIICEIYWISGQYLLDESEVPILFVRDVAGHLCVVFVEETIDDHTRFGCAESSYLMHVGVDLRKGNVPIICVGSLEILYKQIGIVDSESGDVGLVVRMQKHIAQSREKGLGDAAIPAKLPDGYVAKSQRNPKRLNQAHHLGA